MRSLGRLCAIAVAIAAVMLMAGLLPQPFLPAQANTGCPSSSDTFGPVTWTSSCTVDTDTTWGNGTLTLSGSLSVSAGATLHLWNLIIAFSSTSDLQRSLTVYGSLVMEGGALQSADSYHWYLSSSGGSARVVVEHAGLTGAGSGSTFGVVVSGGGGNRFAYDAFSGVNLQVLGSRGDYVGYSNISNYDDSALNQHVVWMGANSTFEHNTMWDITLGTQSAVTNYETYGNAVFFANTLYLRAAGSNSMGFEIINEQSSQVNPIYPGPWVAQLLWNNITYTYVGSGTNSNGFDNEFSERVHIAHNTITNLGSNPLTECIEGGGLTNALVEFNRCYGGSGGFQYGFFDYIYENAQNVFRNNTIDRAGIGAIVQSGQNTFMDNTFTNLSGSGFYLCPNSPCAGSTANTSNNAWYNNTMTFVTGGDLTHMSPSNAFYNVVIAHGASHWTDGATEHAVNGEWLFFANAPIQVLRLADGADGHRTLYMTTAGLTYWDQESIPSVADSTSLSLAGALDPLGSVNGGTVFQTLDAAGNTSVVATATGAVTVSLQAFAPNYTYNVTLENMATHVVRNGTVSTDASGSASFPLAFGTTLSTYSILLWGSFPASSKDTTPPARVTDLRPTLLGSTFAVLKWTAPGNNGSVGQASRYDLRYSTTGPLDNATFDQGVAVAAPAPSPAGSLQTANVTGLHPSTTYWFALRTADAVPNWSPISNVATVTTLPASSNGSVVVPWVLRATLDASASTVEIMFSAPMNRSSVLTALQVVPAASFRANWLNDSHLQVVFTEPLASSTEYVLSIGASAANQGGTPLGAVYHYTFVTPAASSPSPTPVSSSVLVTLASLVAVAGAAAVALLWWSGRLPVVARGFQNFARRFRRRGGGGRSRPPAEPPLT